MRARGIAANSALALAGDLASKAGALLLVFLAARLFPVSEFAVVATALASAGLLTSALDFGAGTLLSRDGAASARARGSLFRALLQARLPLAAALLLGAAVVGAWLGRPVTALAVVALSLSSAVALSVLGLYRSAQDLRPEALQRLGSAVLSVTAVALCGLAAPRADLLLGALASISLLTLLPLVLCAPRLARFDRAVSPSTALRAAAPIGLLALATIAYYRSGTLALAALADARATAAFSVAASLAFGLLVLPNAITTALLPRLAAEGDLNGIVSLARRALAWTLATALPLSAAAALIGPLALPLLLGSEYAGAGLPFALLCVGIPVIAASGLIGTALLALGRLRDLVLQVACSLLVNIAALVVLVPSLGAVGASLATVSCEAAGLLLLLRAARRALPGLITMRPLPLRPPLEAPEAAARP